MVRDWAHRGPRRSNSYIQRLGDRRHTRWFHGVSGVSPRSLDRPARFGEVRYALNRSPVHTGTASRLARNECVSSSVSFWPTVLDAPRNLHSSGSSRERSEGIVLYRRISDVIFKRVSFFLLGLFRPGTSRKCPLQIKRPADVNQSLANGFGGSRNCMPK